MTPDVLAGPVTTNAAPKLISVPLTQLIDREQQRRRRRHIVWIVVAATLPLVALSAWLVWRPRAVPLPQRYRTETVTRGNLVREVRATGHVEAVSTIQVGAEISGRIASVAVDFNDRVKAGQVLARFDRISLAAQRAQAEAAATAAQANTAQAEFDLEQATRTLARVQRLYLRGAQSEQDNDNAVTTARLAHAKLAAARAQLEAQRAALAVARNNLDHAVIRSPVDGVIITRNVDPGQTVAAALQTPVLFTVAVDLAKMRVIAAVDEADIGEVVAGQPASFTVNAYPDRPFRGVVTEVRNSPAIVQDVVTYGVVIETRNPDLALKPGMTASARIRTGVADDALLVPNSALHFTPPDRRRDDAPAVYVFDGGRVRKQAVELGISDGESTELRGGLPKGAQVLVDLTARGKKAYERAK